MFSFTLTEPFNCEVFELIVVILNLENHFGVVLSSPFRVVVNMQASIFLSKNYKFLKVSIFLRETEKFNCWNTPIGLNKVLHSQILCFSI